MIIAFLLAWIKSYREANSYACAIIADSSAGTACRVAAVLAFCREATASHLFDDYRGWTVKANFAGLTTRWLTNLSGINLACGISQMLAYTHNTFPLPSCPTWKKAEGKFSEQLFVDDERNLWSSFGLASKKHDRTSENRLLCWLTLRAWFLSSIQRDGADGAINQR